MTEPERKAFAVDYLKYRYEGLNRKEIAKRMDICYNSFLAKYRDSEKELNVIIEETKKHLRQDIVIDSKEAVETIRLLLKSDNDKIKLDASKIILDRVLPTLNEVDHKVKDMPMLNLYLNEKPKEIVVKGTDSVNIAVPEKVEGK